MSASVKLGLCTMIVIGGIHRTHDRKIVDAATKVRQPVADRDAAPAVFLESNPRGKQLVALLTVGVVDDRYPRELQPLRVLHIPVRSLTDRLAGIFVQFWLGIERFQVADAAVHEQPNNRFGLGCKMGLSVGRCPGILRRSISIAVQNRGQRQSGKAKSHVCQERPPMGARTATCRFVRQHHRHPSLANSDKIVVIDKAPTRLTRALRLGSEYLTARNSAFHSTNASKQARRSASVGS